MKVNDAIAGFVLAVLAIAVLLHTRGFPAVHGQVFGPAVFPNVAAVVMLGCALLLVARGWRARTSEPWFVPPPWLRSPAHAGAFALVVLGVVAYIALADVVGFFIVGAVLLFLLMRVLGTRTATAAVVALLATVVIWYAFYKLLRVPLPWGILQRFAI